MHDPGPPARQAYFTRSKTATAFKAAGVLPFAVHSGQVLVLLGAEPTRTGPSGKVERIMWRDFGGQREAIDIDVEACASREFAEETLGIFGGCGVNASSVAASACTMADQLRRNFSSLHVIHPLKKGEYHMFCAQTTYIEPLMFYLAIQQNEHTKAVAGAEKTAFAWVHLQELLSAVATCGRRYDLHTSAAISGSGVGRKLLAKGTRRLQLHPCFAKSLRMAKEAGLLTLVTGAKALPLPPPACMPSLATFPDPSAEGTCSEENLGITPEHLLYWTQQEVVASVLYGPADAEELATTPSLASESLGCAGNKGDKVTDDLCAMAGILCDAQAVSRDGDGEATGMCTTESEAPLGFLQRAGGESQKPSGATALCPVLEGQFREGEVDEGEADLSRGVATCTASQGCGPLTSVTGDHANRKSGAPSGPLLGPGQAARDITGQDNARGAFGQGSVEALAGLSMAAALWREAREDVGAGKGAVLAGALSSTACGTLLQEGHRVLADASSVMGSEQRSPCGGGDGCYASDASPRGLCDAQVLVSSRCEAGVAPLEVQNKSRTRSGTSPFAAIAVAVTGAARGPPHEVVGGAPTKRLRLGCGGG